MLAISLKAQGTVLKFQTGQDLSLRILIQQYAGTNPDGIL